MYTHRARLQLRPNSFIELSQTIQNKIMPALRGQQGFRNGVTAIDTIWRTAVEDTFWETKENAEAYQRTGYLETLRYLSALLETEPLVSIFEDAPARAGERRK